MESSTATVPATPEAPSFGEMSFEDAIRLMETSAKARTPEPDPEPSAPAPVQVAPETPTTPPEQPTESRAAAIKRAVEAREAAKAREAEASKATVELETLRKQVAELQASQAQARDRFRQNPAAYLKALDPDVQTEKLAERFWTEKLGDAAPADVRARLEVERVEALMAQRTAELEAKFQAQIDSMQNQQRQAAYAQYTGAVQSYLTNAPAELELVGKFAKANPEKATAAAIKIAEKAAASGKLLTPEQCARQLDKDLNAFRSLFTSSTTTTTTQPTPAPPAQPTTTLRNGHTQVVPSRTDDDDEALFQMAMKKALAGRATE